VFYRPTCTFLLYCYVCCFIVQYVITLSRMFVLLVLCLFFVLYGCFLFSVPCYCIVCFVLLFFLCAVFVFFVPVYGTLLPGGNPIAVNKSN
jgi:hypothetical protein